MAGLGPAIHVFDASTKQDVDAPNKSGHDESLINIVGRMPASEIPRNVAIADEPAEVVIVERELLGRGFCSYERVQARRADRGVETRDLLPTGAVS